MKLHILAALLSIPLHCSADGGSTIIESIDLQEQSITDDPSLRALGANCSGGSSSLRFIQFPKNLRALQNTTNWFTFTGAPSSKQLKLFIDDKFDGLIGPTSREGDGGFSLYTPKNSVRWRITIEDALQKCTSFSLTVQFAPMVKIKANKLTILPYEPIVFDADVTIDPILGPGTHPEYIWRMQRKKYDFDVFNTPTVTYDRFGGVGEHDAYLTVSDGVFSTESKESIEVVSKPMAPTLTIIGSNKCFHDWDAGQIQNGAELQIVQKTSSGSFIPFQSLSTSTFSTRKYDYPLVRVETSPDGRKVNVAELTLKARTCISPQICSEYSSETSATFTAARSQTLPYCS